MPGEHACKEHVKVFESLQKQKEVFWLQKTSVLTGSKKLEIIIIRTL